MKSICRNIFLIWQGLSLSSILFALSLAEAEQKTLYNSQRLQAANLDLEVVTEQEGAGFAAMLPKISLQGNYTYLSTLPSLAFSPGAPAYTFGSHHNYSLGPALNYTLWDTFSSFNAFQALRKLKESKQQDRASTQRQVLLAVRSAYVRVQLALEEMRLVSNSLRLVQDEQRDIQMRLKAGAATQLDKLIANHQVLNFELQSEQKKAEFRAAWKDLQALTGEIETQTLDSLSETLHYLDQFSPSAPGPDQPQIKSLRLLSESSEKSAAAQSARLFPTLQLAASSTLSYPNGPVTNQINQNMIGLVLSIPLYIGDPTWHLAASKRREAAAIQHRANQLQIDFRRDFEKSKVILESLREQKKLSLEEVSGSEEAAKLYYDSYKAGRLNLIDVQTANHQALQSKVNSARIDAQILNQLILLNALSGEMER